MPTGIQAAPPAQPETRVSAVTLIVLVTLAVLSLLCLQAEHHQPADLLFGAAHVRHFQGPGGVTLWVDNLAGDPEHAAEVLSPLYGDSRVTILQRSFFPQALLKFLLLASAMGVCLALALRGRVKGPRRAANYPLLACLIPLVAGSAAVLDFPSSATEVVPMLPFALGLAIFALIHLKRSPSRSEVFNGLWILAATRLLWVWLALTSLPSGIGFSTFDLAVGGLALAGLVGSLRRPVVSESDSLVRGIASMIRDYLRWEVGLVLLVVCAKPLFHGTDVVSSMAALAPVWVGGLVLSWAVRRATESRQFRTPNLLRMSFCRVTAVAVVLGGPLYATRASVGQEHLALWLFAVGILILGGFPWHLTWKDRSLCGGGWIRLKLSALEQTCLILRSLPDGLAQSLRASLGIQCNGVVLDLEKPHDLFGRELFQEFVEQLGFHRVEVARRLTEIDEDTEFQALVLMALPPEIAAEVFKSYTPEEVQEVTLAITRLPQVEWQQRAAAVVKFLEFAEPRFQERSCAVLQSRLKEKRARVYSSYRKAARVAPSSRGGSSLMLLPVVLAAGLLLVTPLVEGRLAPAVTLQGQVDQLPPRLVRGETGVAIASLQGSGLERVLLQHQPEWASKQVAVTTRSTTFLTLLFLPLSLLALLLEQDHRIRLGLAGVHFGFALAGLAGWLWISWLPFAGCYWLLGLAPINLKGRPWRRARVKETRKRVNPKRESVEERPVRPKPDRIKEMELDPVTVEIGRGLLEMVFPPETSGIFSRVTEIRSHMARDFGVLPPGVRFRDNLALPAHRFRILRRGIPYLEADLVDGDRNGEAEALLRRALREFSGDFVTLSWIDSVLKTRTDLDSLQVEMARSELGLLKIQDVLRGLLAEEVSIRDLDAILALMLRAPVRDSETELVERVRKGLTRSICYHLCDDKTLRLVSVGELLVRKLSRDELQELLEGVDGPFHALLCSPRERPLWARLARGLTAVLATDELDWPRVETVGELRDDR